MIISNIQKSFGKGSGWIIDSVIDEISKCNLLAGSSYIKLPKELDQPKKAWSLFKILMIMKALIGV